MDVTAAGPRIPPVTSPNAEQQELLSKTLLTKSGRPLNLFATLAHNPRLLKRFNALGGYFLRHGLLPARDRELVILRVAALTGSRYEYAQHVGLGADAGLSAEEISRTNGPIEGWSDADRLLLQFVDEMVATDGAEVPSWVALVQAYSDEQMLELTLLIGFYRMLAGFLIVVGVEVEEELEAGEE